VSLHVDYPTLAALADLARTTGRVVEEASAGMAAAADVAVDAELLKLYPFCRLAAPANILVMPALHSASIASKLLKQLGGGQVIGPILLGLDRPVQIVPMDAGVSDILNLGAIAAFLSIQDGAQMPRAAE
jgi:predicted protein tyrosine phosphatase